MSLLLLRYHICNERHDSNGDNIDKEHHVVVLRESARTCYLIGLDWNCRSRRSGKGSPDRIGAGSSATNSKQRRLSLFCIGLSGASTSNSQYKDSPKDARHPWSVRQDKEQGSTVSIWVWVKSVQSQFTDPGARWDPCLEQG